MMPITQHMTTMAMVPLNDTAAVQVPSPYIYWRALARKFVRFSIDFIRLDFD